MAHTGNSKIIDSTEKDFDEKSFYGHSQSSHRLGCNCLTMGLLFLILLIGLFIFVYYSSRTTVIPTSINAEDWVKSARVFTTKYTDQIKSAISGTNEEANIVIGEEEITSLLRTHRSSATVVIEPDAMYIKDKIYGFDGYVEVVPSVENSKLVFEPIAVQVGSIKLPAQLAYPEIWALNRVGDTFAKEAALIDIESVSLQYGAMIISGQVIGR